MTILDRIKRILRVIHLHWCGLKRETKARICLCVLFLVLGLFLGKWIGMTTGHEKGLAEGTKKAVQVEQQKNEEILQLQAEKEAISDKLKNYEETPKLKELPWNLTLVNWEHEMKKGYRPELAEIQPGYYVDVRILQALQEMLNDAEADGMRIEICSAYRSVKRQKEIFDESVAERLYRGMGYWDAYEDTLKSVNAPGTSEHGLGLAVDLVSTDYTELDKKQAETAEAKWLEEHCHEYGFILRYPPAKTKETGIIYEPWHYRYVGVDIATEIMKAGITLETYLEDYE